MRCHSYSFSETNLICVRAQCLSMGDKLSTTTATDLVQLLSARIDADEDDDACRLAAGAALGTLLALPRGRECAAASTVVGTLLGE